MEQDALIKLGLRRRRTSLRDKTLLKDSASRRDTFAAALDQFEELMAAAAAVSPASRPIMLYYATCQAGLAICAAHQQGTFSFSKHGLKVAEMPAGVSDLVLIQDASEGAGGFQTVAQATGSPLFDGRVRFGALWASLPDMDELPALPGSDDPAALTIMPGERHFFNGDGDGSSPLSASVIIQQELPGPDEFAQRLADILADYPSAAGAVAVPGSYRAIREGRWTADIQWPQRLCVPGEGKAELRGLAPEYRHNDEYFLRPAVTKAGGAPPTPLMTWWALLYALSMLARYQPRRWTQMLNIDRSEEATLLEYFLDTALSAVPHLIAEALDAKPLLLRQVLHL